MKPSVGIVGYGIVGKAHEIAFEQDCDVLINDPKFTHLSNHVDKKELMGRCEAIFICVPTPYNPLERVFNDKIIQTVMKQLDENRSSRNNPVVVIKSAVIPSVVKELVEKYPKLLIIVNPEYLSERNSIADLLAQETLILGGPKYGRERIKELFLNHSRCNKKCTIGEGDDAAEIAMIKYMENAFLAVKVIFMNEFKELFDKMFDKTDDKAFNEIIKIHQLDTRMGGTYPAIIPGPDGHLGFGGKCLPKDILSIISEAEGVGSRMHLLSTTWTKNLKIRSDRNWTEIEGAVE